MLTIFGATGGGLLSNPLIVFLSVLVITYVFVKFCSWAKSFELSSKVKLAIYILTGLGLVGFNVMYYQGNAAIQATGDWGAATTALLVTFAWVFVFAFALMSEKKAE
ncbi:hypothetical protein SYNTR_0418 [Candidatus Syntrophocurvum alkaliphilum]|uniref:Uncharacterized protein n=1 Tax=Candidatus Syntrophocurvum alkaliphilum TaxID=2293317 RepID=A0A6I6DEV1_9FIRM|nr:hypothetical protein [Candidatus Syntrophocurvum alkaliphilum]QGT99011.1 hypothetical protein SYNTR_0418 [Candidatus Syntrophocurvum alkaliphilum]